MKNIIFFSTLILLFVAAFISACQKEVTGNAVTDIGKPHSLKIYLTDDQTPVFDSIFVDIQKLEVKLEDDTSGTDGWVQLNINPGIYNILRFRNGLDTLFATGTLPNARLRKLRLTLGTRNSAMKNGQSFPLTIHDNDREVIANLDNSNFEIVQPDQLLFWIDFDAGRSIQVNNSGPGNNNGYRLRSHIKVFSRNNTGRIEGRVLPSAADALVMAINGTDTTVALPDRDGEFKIVGLDAGVYKVFFDGQNNYNDTTVSNLIVRSREDTHLAAITLHQ